MLTHNGKPIAEPVVIVEYMDEAWSDLYPLLPSNPYQKATTCCWAKFAEEKVNNHILVLSPFDHVAMKQILKFRIT